MNTVNKIDNYTVLQTCGKGAFGKVYLVENDKGELLALKKISLLGRNGDRELQAVMSYKKCLSCKSLMDIYEIKITEDYFYYTMPLADNISGNDFTNYKPHTLAEDIQKKGPLKAAYVTILIDELLNGLCIIHKNKLVHRDIKPSNVLWINKHATLGDIGLMANELSMTINAGTPGYLPPPNSPISINSAAVDLYALQVLIQHCLTGKLPKNNQIGNFDLTEDIIKNGKALLKILELSQDELKDMTADDLKKIFSRCCTAQYAYHADEPTIKTQSYSTSKQDDSRPKNNTLQNDSIPVAEMNIEDVFTIEGRGAVVYGLVKRGTITNGDSVEIVRSAGTTITAVVTGIAQFNELLDSARPSKKPYGILLNRMLTPDDIKQGDKLIKRKNLQSCWRCNGTEKN